MTAARCILNHLNLVVSIDMPLVKTVISYEEEEYGRQEASTFQRELDDLDIYDWMWYLMKVTEMAGFDAKQISIECNNGKIYRTDL